MLSTKSAEKTILRPAYALDRGNADAPGVDGEGFAHVESSGIETSSITERHGRVGSRRYCLR
jgi:hypothetical protein